MMGNCFWLALWFLGIVIIWEIPPPWMTCGLTILLFLNLFGLPLVPLENVGFGPLFTKF